MISIDQEQSYLVDGVCGDSKFLKPIRNSQILRALFSNPNSKEDRKKAVQDILDGDSDIKCGVGISTEMTRLQQRLDEYFDTRGKHHRWRIVIRRGGKGDPQPKDLYRLSFPSNVPSETAIHSLWKPYLDGRPVVLSYGQPISATETMHDVFIRDVQVNLKKDFDSLPEKSPIRRLPVKDRVHTYAFASLGEMLCMVELALWFGPQGVDVMVEGYDRDADFNSFLNHRSGPEGANSILLGSTRINGVLAEYQTNNLKKSPDIPYVLQDKGISQRKKPKELLVEKSEKDVSGLKTVAYALAIRMPGIHSGTITLLTSTNGRAIYGLGKILTTGDTLTQVLERFSGTWPERFQLLYRFDIADGDRVIVDSELLDWWPRSSKPQP